MTGVQTCALPIYNGVYMEIYDPDNYADYGVVDGGYVARRHGDAVIDRKSVV